MDELERNAYLYGGQNGAEYLKSIGKDDLKDLTGDEWLTFCECICKNYHVKLIEFTNAAG